MKLQEMTVKQLKTRKRLGAGIAFLLSVLPVSIVVACKWGIWVERPEQAIAIGTGGIMVGVVVVLSILGRLKIGGDVWVAAFFFVLLLLLKAVINDLLLLTGTYLAGRICDKILTAAYVKRVISELKDRELAERTSKTAIEAVKEYLGGEKV